MSTTSWKQYREQPPTKWPIKLNRQTAIFLLDIVSTAMIGVCWRPAGALIGIFPGSLFAILFVLGTAHWVNFWEAGRAADTRAPFGLSGLILAACAFGLTLAVAYIVNPAGPRLISVAISLQLAVVAFSAYGWLLGHFFLAIPSRTRYLSALLRIGRDSSQSPVMYRAMAKRIPNLESWRGPQHRKVVRQERLQSGCIWLAERARAFAELDMPEEARKVIEMLLQLDESDEVERTAHSVAAWALLILGEKTAEARDLRRAMELKKDYALRDVRWMTGRKLLELLQSKADTDESDQTEGKDRREVQGRTR